MKRIECCSSWIVSFDENYACLATNTCMYKSSELKKNWVFGHFLHE